ncbi:TON1 Recruiting Motif 26 [Hibiscus trionum]|uniref:TON1 Recruiting Motif 26 n=1 Tax=Hibiscus trionum TaxID=183268 RepID=A0A9W7J744_HIBTR|nr:TON1 Recruiting Motif 26 [Hibiscus trionum]
MGGIFHLFDFHQGSMARKILAKKKHVDVLEAPPNSLELQLDPSQSYSAAGDLPCSYQVEEDWSARNYYQPEASMKKLISEEMSKQSNTRHNSPSIVARLMGMDPLPSDTKSVVQPVTKKSDNRLVELYGREKNVKDSNLYYLKQMEVDSIYSTRDRDAERSNTDLKFGKPRRREHPQEEELQRFKKEFEAWQVARLRECTKVFDVESISPLQFTQERQNKERKALYAESVQAMHEKPFESKRFAVQEKGLHHQRCKSELFTAQQNESRRQSINRDFRVPSTMDYNDKLDAAPTRIVILKPGPDGIYDHEESWTSSPSTFQDRASMEDFLEEVRERLKSELQGKALNRKKSFVARGSGIETPFSEKPSSDPRQIAKHITNQVRQNDSRDIRMNLVRSESTRSYRSDITFNEPGSPEFIDKDTRRFLSERLRNVLKEEIQFDVPIVSTCSFRSSVFDYGRERIKRMQDMSKSGHERSDWEIVKHVQGMQTRSFRHGDDELSPRNLIRSLSAPVSGTSFGKLLLEDRHVVTGAQIRTKHEGIETESVDIRRKKDKFNLKEKVSNIKYGLTLRRRLFGKKIQSMVESYGSDNDLAKDILSGPTVIMNLGKSHENPTEVPPSPASICSSPHEEYWREVDYLSLISTPDATVRDDNAAPQGFREISSNLNELTRQVIELESDEANRITIEQEPTESETVNLEDHAQGYVRDLLIASGLYDGLCDKSLPRCDPLAQLISKSVFEQVEEYHRKSAKENDNKVDHKVLLDLSNEALSTILGPPVTMCRFRRKILGSTILTPPEGRKLLNSVWEFVHINLHPPIDTYNCSLETMVAGDLGSAPWTGLVDEETNGLGREVEWHIIGDLVEEIVKDICIHEGWHL